MAYTNSSGKRPLSLYQVLEAEYIALHMAQPTDSQRDADQDKRLNAICTLIHAEKQSALCISGGGIRSATFALGVLQGLARIGLLQKFDYLSTVSGGGYIGSWLSSYGLIVIRKVWLEWPRRWPLSRNRSCALSPSLWSICANTATT